MKIKDSSLGYFFVAPAIIFILGFMVYPMIVGIRYSFLDMDLTRRMGDFNFVGIGKYKEIFSDTVFWSSVINSIIFVVSSVLIHQVLGFALALSLNQKIKGRLFFRGVNILPWAISGVSVALIWTWIYHPQLGVLNDFFMRIKILKEPVVLLGNPKTALIGVIVAHNWRTFPFTFVMILAGLQTMPLQLYEAASIDGASVTQKFFHITLPLMAKIILTIALLDTIWTFIYFDLPYVMTGGGPIHATELMTTYIYELSFNFYRFGKGAALAVFLFGINLIFTLIYIFIYRKTNV